MALKAPFPYFGGKSLVADQVWTAIGQVEHYMEPFFGSGAVLLARPGYDPIKHTETVNDADGYLCNVWRAIQFSPDETAKWCDWPVNHADLSARKTELLRNRENLLQGLVADPKWHDPVLAGYWIWSAGAWIGSGLTSIGKRPHLGNKGQGVHAAGKIPLLGNKGQGVHAVGQIPHLAGKGQGVHAAGKRPHIGNKGVGVHAAGKRPHLTDKGVGVHAVGQRPHLAGEYLEPDEPHNANIYKWFRQLSERLRYVRVVCGDWSKICGGDWQDNSWNTVGIFFDPPYAVENRALVYDHDSFDVAHKVRDWAIKRGKKSTHRIVIAGYDEHNDLENHGWTKALWKTAGGYGRTQRNNKECDSRGKVNRRREVLWFSPHCLKSGLFD